MSISQGPPQKYLLSIQWRSAHPQTTPTVGRMDIATQEDELGFESVDALQKTLADTVFYYASDRKKAAGRALGTLVEIVTYYTLRA